MKRKLIQMHQEHSIVCDNKECNYKIKNETGDPNEDISKYLNEPCPDCGENLLTEADYLQSLKVLKVVNWINKWFNWTLIFIPKKSKGNSISVHCHQRVNIISERNSKNN